MTKPQKATEAHIQEAREGIIKILKEEYPNLEFDVTLIDEFNLLETSDNLKDDKLPLHNYYTNLT